MDERANQPDGPPLSPSANSERSALATTRRAFLRKVGLRAAYIIPVVMTLTARQARADASPSNPSCIPNGGLCSDDADCCSGKCHQGVCSS